MADIGSHWMDLAQHVAGARIVEVMADLATVVPVRYAPGSAVETFQHARGRDTAEARPVRIETEDFASVLLRFDTGARGAVTVSQVSTGRKNRLLLEVDGARGALAWNSEQGEDLWLGARDEPSRVAQRGPSNAPLSNVQVLPPGHVEGWLDALHAAIAGFYGLSRGEASPWVASFEDGLVAVALTEAILDSHRLRRWVSIPQPKQD